MDSDTNIPDFDLKEENLNKKIEEIYIQEKGIISFHADEPFQSLHVKIEPVDRDFLKTELISPLDEVEDPDASDMTVPLFDPSLLVKVETIDDDYKRDEQHNLHHQEIENHDMNDTKTNTVDPIISTQQ